MSKGDRPSQTISLINYLRDFARHDHLDLEHDVNHYCLDIFMT